MKENPESEDSNVKQRNIKRNDDLNGILKDLPTDYIIRINKAEADINKTWYNIEDAEIKIDTEGINIIKAKVKGCITSW